MSFTFENTCMTIDEIVTKFENVLINCNEHSVSRRKRCLHRFTKSTWFDRDCKNYKTKVNMRNFRRYKSVTNLNMYMSIKTAYRTMCNKKRYECKTKVINTLSNSVRDQKAFWMNIKKLQKRR